MYHYYYCYVSPEAQPGVGRLLPGRPGDTISNAIPTTINHRLLMLKIIYIRNKIVEHSMAQITYINILTNIQEIFNAI